MYVTNIENFVSSVNISETKSKLLDAYVDWRENVLHIKITRERAERTIDQWIASGVNKIVQFTNNTQPALIVCHAVPKEPISVCNVMFVERDLVQKLTSVPRGSEEIYVKTLLKSMEHLNLEKRIKAVNLEV